MTKFSKLPDRQAQAFKEFALAVFVTQREESASLIGNTFKALVGGNLAAIAFLMTFVTAFPTSGPDIHLFVGPVVCFQFGAGAGGLAAIVYSAVRFDSDHVLGTTLESFLKDQMDQEQVTGKTFSHRGIFLFRCGILGSLLGLICGAIWASVIVFH